MDWTIILAFLAGGLTAPFSQAAVRWAWRRWRERGQSVAIGVDVASDDWSSIAIATKRRDGTVHYEVAQIPPREPPAAFRRVYLGDWTE